MKELVLCDDGHIEKVLPLCEKYGLGIEIQGFHKPTSVDNYEEILKQYQTSLPEGISKYFHAPFADLCLGSSNPKIVEVTKFYFDYAYKIAVQLNCKRITVHYGYVPNTISGDGEELDAYLLGVFEPVEEYEGECIAIIHRTNDDDDKLVIVPAGKEYSDDAINALTEFQEQYFEHVIIKNKKNTN